MKERLLVSHVMSIVDNRIVAVKTYSTGETASDTYDAFSAIAAGSALLEAGKTVLMVMAEKSLTETWKDLIMGKNSRGD